MTINRRNLLSGFGSFFAMAAFRPLGVQSAPGGASSWSKSITSGSRFPRKADFIIEDGYSYLNAAYTHPIPKDSLEAARQAAERRATLRQSQPRSGSNAAQKSDPKVLFAELINAKPTEIAYVSSTSHGENLVVQALELDRRFDGNVVTDGLHFEGSIMHLFELKKRGLDVRVVRPTAEYRIDMRDLENAVDGKTRLIEVSSTAMYNGFQHDLKAVSDLAHANGAYVYADIVQSAGAEPLDVRTSGIDFASCSSFKWLMGDFGLGFLYVREGVLDKIQRPVVGYYQAPDLEAHYPPNLPAGEYKPIEYDLTRTATALFEMGSLVGSTEVNVALLAASLNYIKSLGVANIQAYRKPLIEKLQREVPRFGFLPVTPPESTGGIVTFAKTDLIQSDIPQKLQAAKVNVRLSRHWMRISPSVYNDMNDIDHFLEAL
jgi:selenocysteine lyase/cysteine desulfurase